MVLTPVRIAASIVALTLGCAGDMGGGAGAVPDGAVAPIGDGQAPTADAPPVVTGGPGCGMDSAAFCDTFEAPSPGGRAGDLQEAHWSGSRLSPAGPTSDGKIFAIGPATLRSNRGGERLPACRADLPDQVFPDRDTLICDAASNIDSAHLLVAVAAQNYGENSYRIRQPFDFAGRTGTIVLDAEAYAANSLLGWISIEVTEDPTPTPGFAVLDNYEGTPLPRNGFALQLDDTSAECVRVGTFSTFVDHVETDVAHENLGPCQATQWGHLNHLEVKVAQDLIEVFASPASADGTTFGEAIKVFSAPVGLPFTRGYVHVTVHNHATLKYWEDYGGFLDLDAWVARFDNVGFDGPVLALGREVEVAQPHLPAADTLMLDIGWLAPDRAVGASVPLVLPAVDLTGMTRARIALTSWYCRNCGTPLDEFVLHYRLNGGAWHDRRLTGAEQAALQTGSGAISHLLDVPLDELVAGDNTLEVSTTGVPQSYPPGVLNVDLILD